MNIYDITASALTAQRLRLDTVAGNLANVNTTRKEDGTIGAYRRKNVVFAPLLDAASDMVGSQSLRPSPGDLPMRPTPNGISLDAGGRPMLTARIQNNSFEALGVQITSVKEDTNTPTRQVYDPSHPDANAQGYVEMPNINVVSEMVDMISASRAYEANVTALQSAKAMGRAALDI
jgi:flagellar basal-body rod protein FlgC